MSDLQLSLIVLALFAIAGVWLFNRVMDGRRTRAFEQHAKTRSTPRSTEPDATVGPAVGGEPTMRAEPTFNEPADDAVAAAAVPASPEPVETVPGVTLIDDEIHAVVTIEPDGVLSGERAWALLHPFRHAGRQPVTLVGVRGDLQEPIKAGQRYEAVLVAVQLANRSGPLNEIEWSEFVAALQHVCEQIPANCEIPDMRETTARARQLDARCVPLDAQIGINLTTMHSAWSGEHVADLARQNGLILRPDGRFHALDEQGMTLFILQNGDGGAFRADTLESQQTSRLTLLLDVPRAPQVRHPFDRLVELANRLAQSLEAAIVDDQSHLLTPASLASIGRQIDPVYAKLEAAGMAAGSPRALALFG